MSAKKHAPARDRRVTAAEFLDWVCEAIERREARRSMNGPRMPQDALATLADRSDVEGRPGLTGEPRGHSLGAEMVAGLAKMNDALDAGVPLGECAIVRIATSGDKDAGSGVKGSRS
jgi:hypothetical protein